MTDEKQSGAMDPERLELVEECLDVCAEPSTPMLTEMNLRSLAQLTRELVISNDHWETEARSREPSSPRDPMSYARVLKDRNRLEAEVATLKTEIVRQQADAAAWKREAEAARELRLDMERRMIDGGAL